MSDPFEDADDYDYSDADDCDCADYDVDTLDGRAWCLRCGRGWFLTSEELTKELNFQAEYMENMAAEYEAANQISSSQPDAPSHRASNKG